MRYPITASAFCEKMAVFMESPLLQLIIAMKLYSYNLTHIAFGAFVTVYSILNFLLPWQRGDISKNAKNHYFALLFTIKTDFKVPQLLNGLKLSQ
jgi:hypothetical protein